MSAEPSIETKTLSSLSKVFPDEDIAEQPVCQATALAGETYSFQVAYRAQGVTRTIRGVRVKVESRLEPFVSVRTVGWVPSELPMYPEYEGTLLRSAPGLFPDPLLPVSETEGHLAVPGQWRSLWVGAELGGSIPEGVYPIRIMFEAEDGRLLGEAAFELTLLPAALPDQTLIHTEWFHADCLAVHYNVEVFGEEHWRLMEAYADAATRHGVNMLLTPLFTPPLDTKVGGERPTVQLIDVIKNGESYSFGFGKLRRWVEMCGRVGIRYLEMSHLFTQWGAKHAPKIVAAEDGQPVKLFGWETDASSDAYKAFLDAFLPELVAFLKENGLERRCFFHISDEPHKEHLLSYRSARESVRRHLEDFPIIDALSDYDFYEQGDVPTPIPASNKIAPFLQGNVEPLWTYYCCSQFRKVSNRFFAFPSARNRVIGVQLYKFDIAGFLHWGYNFWFTQYSVSSVDPFHTTDAGCAFPSGDAFLVYPGKDGPIESIRMEVFYEALQDLRALRLLESLIGREETLRLVEEGLAEPLTFDQFPQDAEWLLGLRERVNRRIQEKIVL
ncbi:DUF4091 domain-containing protein [Paenibacillus hamazuiensis]|uniref:DUF4091 domain-containing protein n=1 Tax=Paenibacillus hamazuiensis TaxID=2936508 RepID=UPI0020103277|nr:DUF4091 domain-containing protein [Paenibacillus hamazuiensis]